MPLPIKPITRAIKSADEAADNLAKYLSNSQIKERLYHITPNDFNKFKPGGDDPTRSGTAIWLTTNKEFQPAAHRVSFIDEQGKHYPISGDKAKFKPGTNVMPVHAQANKPLVLDDPTMVEWAREVFAKGNKEFPELMAPKWAEAVKKEGYDSVLFADPYKKGQAHEVIVFEPTQVKSAIGNRGTFDPTNPDITKAEGGQINPIKSPREILYELAGIPHMSEGRAVPAMTPEEMRALMLQYGYTPEKFKNRTLEMLSGGAEKAKQAGSAIAKTAPARAVAKTAGIGLKALGPAVSAVQAYDTGRRLSKGDYLGATNAAISAGLNFAGPLGMLGALPFDLMNQIRDEQMRQYRTGEEEDFEPTENYRSVMEGYR